MAKESSEPVHFGRSKIIAIVSLTRSVSTLVGVKKLLVKHCWPTLRGACSFLYSVAFLVIVHHLKNNASCCSSLLRSGLLYSFLLFVKALGT